MKKLFVLSDSHGATGMLELCAQYIEERSFNRIIHLGDFRKDAEWLEERLGVEVLGVAGNCDLFSHDIRETIIRLEKVNIFICHGDKYGVKTGYDRLSYHTSEMTCNMALFGHTHQEFAQDVGGVMLVNPGTLLNGRAAENEIDGDKITVTHVRV